MRRLLVLLLALCLSGSALASPLTALEIDPDPWWKEHGISAQTLPYDPQAGVSSAREADVLCVYSNAIDLRALDGELADLSVSPALRSAVARMVPAARNAVTAADGQILALPVRFHLCPLYANSEAWAAAGLEEADLPRSYEELLDFLDTWAQNPREGVCVSRLTRCSTGKERDDYAFWLMELLVNVWRLQRQYAGEPVRFQDEQFIALARRTRETALALYEAEPRKAKRKTFPELFESHVRGGSLGGRESGLGFCVPMRVTADEPALVGAITQWLCVRKGSAYQSEGLAYLEARLETTPQIHCAELYADFAAGDYPLPESAGTTAVSWTGRTASISQRWLDEYRAWNGEVVCFPDPFTGCQERQEARLVDFDKGRIDAEALACAWDAPLEP